MRSLWFSANRWLTWFHRWAGVALCLLFAIWFASGAVLHFVSFPSLSASERHASTEAIDASQLRVAPSDALARIPAATDLRLVSVAGRPMYLVQNPTGIWASVAGDTGELMPAFSKKNATTVAEAFGGGVAASVSQPLDYDQWIVHQHFDPFRPFYRVRLKDGAKTDLYVSARTGEVLQRTRFTERAWNWSGAVVHWIYFTPLRKSWSAWNQFVWWLSLAALLSSAVGTWLGFVRMASNRAAGRGGLSPFRGWMRWHHIIGLFASVIVVTWMLSGWLSMDHGRMFSRGEASTLQSMQMGGLAIGVVAQAATLPRVRELLPASEITFNAIDGHAFMTAYGALGGARLEFLGQVPAQSLPKLPPAMLLSGLSHVWSGRVQPISLSDTHDPMYRLAESAVGAAAFKIEGEPELRVYVDQYSGRLLTVMNGSRRNYAWVYYALHTFQFPVLIEHPYIRTVLVLLLLSLGFTASLTGVVLSVKRLRRISI